MKFHYTRRVEVVEVEGEDGNQTAPSRTSPSRIQPGFFFIIFIVLSNDNKRLGFEPCSVPEIHKALLKIEKTLIW